MKMLKGVFSHTETGKAMNYVAKVAFDLIRTRRETSSAEKVWNITSKTIFSSADIVDKLNAA